uniref:Aquaporin n=1 Tax=Angiostrongylus cantonensis TaxID=6313 RepID=A0A0K0CXX5_ANGCA
MTIFLNKLMTRRGRMIPGVMVKYYGAMAFFFTVTSLLTVGSFVNRGAFVNPLAPVEAYCYGVIGSANSFALFFLQFFSLLYFYCTILINSDFVYEVALLQGFPTVVAARGGDDRRSQRVPAGSVALVITFPLVVAFELAGSFLLRLILPNLPARGKSYTLSAVVAAFLSFALVYVGVPGLNPVVASSRLFGCDGIGAPWFILVYWLCPVIGWLLAAALEKSMTRKFMEKKSN